jgi:N-acetylglucosamine malate deacetylase 2
VHGRSALDAALADVTGGRGLLLLVAAHPDDGVIGAGALLARAEGACIVYLTDGARRDGQDAWAHGFPDPRSYAVARRREAEAALARASLPPDRIFALGIAEGEASFLLVPIAIALGKLIDTLKPRLVLTHPYEGGHADHDAAAFAARVALDFAETKPGRTVLGEFASYHAGAHGKIRRLVFLDHRGCPETLLALDEAAVRVKAEMLACHATQAAFLAPFPRDRERFRRAPCYDFTRPPHAGPLLYEGERSDAEEAIDGVRWRAEAASALERLNPRHTARQVARS